MMSLGRSDEDGEWVLGYDARLMRRVWIRKVPAGTAPLTAERRNLTRATRLRWLQGYRGSDAAWDAYEAPPGAPLTDLLSAPQPWKKVRHWLYDLANEISASAGDNSPVGVLSLDRVWITASGGAKLLDFHAPGATATPEPVPAFEAPAFLNQVAVSALEGRIASAEEGRTGEPQIPVAVRARGFLKSLRGGVDLQPAVLQLRELVQQVSSITRLRRFGLVAGCVVPAVVIAVVGMVGLLAIMAMEKSNPDVERMQTALLYLREMEKGHYPP
jgi:hypothetical protein